MTELTHLSIFSGIGGLDLAAEWAGFRTVGQCEWADYPRAVLEKHWPGLPRWRDIRTLTKESFYEQTGLETVTVLSGGFPCQPFSTAGKRRGKEDDRYLWPEMLRVIQEIRPSWVVGENVAGIVSMVESKSNVGVEGRNVSILPDEICYEATWIQQENMLFVELIESLEGIGYEVQPFIIPACAVDAPHRRDRCAIIAYSNNPETARQREYRGEILPKSKAERFDLCGCNVAHSNSQGSQGSEQHRAFDQGGQQESYRPTGECSAVMANTKGRRKQRKQSERCKTWGFGSMGCTVSDTDNQRLQIPGHEPRIETVQPKDGIELAYRWSAEPNVGRVAHGVPARVDRLKCLGNAVVPQQFYPVFRGIAELEEMYGN